MMQYLRTIVSLMMISEYGVFGEFQGDGTFYGGGGAGEHGSCLLPRDFNHVPLTVAINQEQYLGGESCGKCVRFHGQGQGLGTTPILGPFFATIDNVCPECRYGDLDLGMDGDGRWTIFWEFIPCSEAV